MLFYSPLLYAVSITVNPVNDPPIANDDLASTTNEKPITIVVLLNDSDPDSDTLTTVDVWGEGGPDNGDITLNEEDGTFVYTPDPGFIGLDQFTYRISDGNGEMDTAVGAYFKFLQEDGWKTLRMINLAC